MNKTKLIAEIAAEHNVRLDPDDPAFILVALNEKVLKQKLSQQSSSVSDTKVYIAVAAGVLVLLIGVCTAIAIGAYKIGIRTGKAEAVTQEQSAPIAAEYSVKEQKDKPTKKRKMAGDFDRDTRQHFYSD